MTNFQNNLDRLDRILRKTVILPTISMLLVSAMMLITVSYAWITSTDIYRADVLDLTTTATDRLRITCDPLDSANTGFFTSVNIDDINKGYTGSKNITAMGDSTAWPVSTAGEFTENGFLKFFTGVVDSTGTLMTQVPDPTTNDSKGMYFAFDLFFISSGTYNMYLDEGSEITVVNHGAGKGNLAYSTRVAFVNYGNTEKAEDAVKLNVPINNEFVGYRQMVDGYDEFSSTTEYFVFDGVSYKPKTAFPMNFKQLVEEGLYVIDETKIAFEAPYRIWEPHANMHNDGSRDILTTKPIYTEGDLVTDHDNMIKELPDDVLFNDVSKIYCGQTTPIAALRAGFNKVRIYIWIEGQDVDATDDVRDQTITTNLYFSVI